MYESASGRQAVRRFAFRHCWSAPADDRCVGVLDLGTAIWQGRTVSGSELRHRPHGVAALLSWVKRVFGAKQAEESAAPVPRYIDEKRAKAIKQAALFEESHGAKGAPQCPRCGAEMTLEAGSIPDPTSGDAPSIRRAKRRARRSRLGLPAARSACTHEVIRQHLGHRERDALALHALTELKPNRAQNRECLGVFA